MNRASSVRRILIVDDDEPITQRLAEEFRRDTSLFPVVSNSVEAALEILSRDPTGFVAVLTDLYFDMGRDAADTTGFDLISRAADLGVQTTFYVMSALAGGRRMLEMSPVKPARYFDKFRMPAHDPIWVVIDRDLAGAASPDSHTDLKGHSPDTSFIPQSFLDRMSTSRSIAFAGAGFSAPAGFPNWAQMLRNLLELAQLARRSPETIAICRNHLDAQELPFAATKIRDLLSDAEIAEALGLMFDRALSTNAGADKVIQMDARLSALLHGPWSGIITTNYDNLLEDFAAKMPKSHWRIVRGLQSSIGNVLSPLNSGKFIIKLHGDLSTSKIVLSSAEYGNTYLKSRKAETFLTAAMMGYTLVFIGCSLEDRILQIREHMFATFDGHVPPIYALLPVNPCNSRREEQLRRDYGIHSILYPDGQHEAVDAFLQRIRALSTES